MCPAHYQRWRATYGTKPCAVDLCERPAITRGMCEGHYSRWRDGRPMDTPLNSRRNGGVACAVDEHGRKQCNACLEWLSTDQFALGAGTDGKAPNCKACRKMFRLTSYNITRLDYEAMLASQNGVCAVCGRLPDATKRGFSIDHDHACCPEASKSCGRCIRGILCGPCNRAIGMLRDDPDIITAAANYILKYRETTNVRPGLK